MVANFSSQPRAGYALGLPEGGDWIVRFNSDATQYSPDYAGYGSSTLLASGPPHEGQAQSGTLDIAAFSLMILSQD